MLIITQQTVQRYWATREQCDERAAFSWAATACHRRLAHKADRGGTRAPGLMRDEVAPVSRKQTAPVDAMRNDTCSRPKLYEEAGDFALLLHHSPPNSYREEVHETVQVCIPYEGARYDVLRSSQCGSRLTHRLRTDDILVIPDGQPHAVNWLRSADILSFHFSRCYLERVLDAPVPNLRDAFIVHDRFIFETAIELRQAVAEGGATPMLLGSCAALIAYRIAKQASEIAAGAKEEVSPLALHERSRIAEYIDSHMHRDIKISELASIIGLSQWHFLRRFQVTEGITPYQSIIRQRVERARDLLMRTRYPVSQIAGEVGMSQSHFSRSFLRANGVSPQSFRHRGKN